MTKKRTATVKVADIEKAEAAMVIDQKPEENPPIQITKPPMTAKERLAKFK